MSIVKQREGITRALYGLVETVAIAAIGDLSTVKVKLTKSKRLQRRDFQVTDDKKRYWYGTETLVYIYLPFLQTHQTVRLWRPSSYCKCSSKKILRSRGRCGFEAIKIML